MDKITVSVPATCANLGCGFDCFGLAIDIRNTVTAEVSDRLHIESDLNDPSIPLDETNLIYRSAILTAERFSKCLPPLKLIQHDRIPLSSGMGSSSACTVAGIYIAKSILGIEISDDEALKIATDIEGHPDNAAPCIFGGLTVCMKKDGRLIKKTLPVKDDLSVLVCHPSFRFSTEEARRLLPKTVPMGKAVSNIAGASLFIASVLSGDYSLLSESLDDSLHQPYRKTLIRGYDEITSFAIGNGALGTCISGAGPSVLIFSDTRRLDDLREKISGFAASLEDHWDIYPSSISKQGVIVSF